MADLRELFSSPEEGFRSMWAGLQRSIHTALIGSVTETSDGHNAVVQPTVLQAVQDPTLTQTTYSKWPLLVDSPVIFPGGAGAVLTHGLQSGDEVVSLFMRDPFDFWRQNSGEQQPVSDRRHSVSDHVTLPAVRSDPRRLQQVAPDAMHARSDDKTVVHEVKPGTGVQSFHADPSTAPASQGFDPLSQATKFLSHVVQAARGVMGRAVDGSTEHSHGVDHGIGAWMRAMGAGGLVQTLAHPDLGALLSSAGGAHTVTASPSGVQIASSMGVSISCPPGTLSLPKGGVSGASIQGGGDISGTLDAVEVVSLGNVDARSLPIATSDAAAAAAGVPVGGLYRDTSIASGKTVLVMRAV